MLRVRNWNWQTVPVEEPVGGDNTIALERSEAYLVRGQTVAITGELVDTTDSSKGIVRSEIAVISDILRDPSGCVLL